VAGSPASREQILASLRRARPAPARARAPRAPIETLRFADPAARFADALAEAGGMCVRVPDASGCADALRALPVFDGAARVVSGVEGIRDTSPGGAPSDLARLDLAVLPGAPAVAERGAVWVVPRDLRERAAAFLASHLVLVVPLRELVHELQQAYERIEPSATGFGCFIAGPSKTADIEESLVVGAHGPRSLTVLLHGP
jgi:L-lactate dehydrogenase complex protein LldG